MLAGSGRRCSSCSSARRSCCASHGPLVSFPALVGPAATMEHLRLPRPLPMNKSELAAHVATQTALSRAQADAAVGAVFSAIGEALAGGESVVIAGFGTFTTKERGARQGRNPSTGEAIAIAASRAPAFKAGKALRDAVRA